MDLWQADARELGALYRRGATTPVEVLEALYGRIDRHDRGLGCFLALLRDDARAAAVASAARHRRDEPLSPLDGVPVAIKDNLCLRGHRATAGSRILENYVATYDAHVVERLAAAGAIALGKTNMDEFAMGSSSENSGFRPVKNPWDPSKVPGGSSGGSAAAVAAGFAPLGLGSDTGGSVRQPAAFSGVFGLRPTYGAVSRYGLIAFASSLDQIGPFARTAADAAALLQAIAGRDTRDATCSGADRGDYGARLEAGVRGLRVGVPREYFVSGLDPEMAAAVQAVLARLESAGASLVPVSLPHTDHGIATYYVVANAEASSNLARFDGVRYGLRVAGDTLAGMVEATRSRGFGAEVKRRIMLGTYALSAGYYDAYYLRGLRVRALIREDFRRALAGTDVLVTPTSPTPAFALGERTGDPLAMYLSDVYTVPSALAGIPGLAVPCGRSKAGLPLSVQVLGRPFAEATLFQVAAAIEREFPLLPRVAPLEGG
jgi:aspartyl-tRNA(Asn)/glutamyl-tRNA(Gln) amidotransferase subunit A